MKKIIVTVLITLAILAGGLFIYISSGSYDISQLTPHNSLTKWMIRKTKHSSIDSRMTENVVPANIKDSTLIIQGFKHYDEMCTDCHGAPGVRPGELTDGLYPKPPKIFKDASPDDAQEFFWIIKNGIKLTSMPAYAPTHSDKKLWAITAFVTQKLNGMTPDEYREWRKKYGKQSDESSAESDEANDKDDK